MQISYFLQRFLKILLLGLCQSYSCTVRLVEDNNVIYCISIIIGLEYSFVIGHIQLKRHHIALLPSFLY